MSVLIRDGLVFSSDGLRVADVAVRDGVIEQIGAGIEVEADRVVDATGCLVGPGLVDLHAHFRDPGQTGAEDLESGSASAAAGGFTAVVVMPNTAPPIDHPALVADILRRGRAIGDVEVAVAGALTRDRAGVEATDLEALYEAGVRIFTDDGDCLEDPEVLQAVMERLAALPGAVLAQHAEETARTSGGHMHQGSISARVGVGGLPAEAEEEIVARDLELVRRTGVRYHCQHVSSEGTVELISRAKQQGLPVTAEVAPHHLSFDESHVEGLDPNFKMYPPLRRAEDRLALRSALIDGTIDVVATDHAPHPSEEKSLGFVEAPRGVIGLETAAAVVWETVGDPERFFECLSIQPARIAGLDSHGLRLAAGRPANIVVFDPDARWTVGRFVSKSENSPYVGMEMSARAIATMYRGKIAHHKEQDRV